MALASCFAKRVLPQLVHVLMQFSLRDACELIFEDGGHLLLGEAELQVLVSLLRA